MALACVLFYMAVVYIRPGEVIAGADVLHPAASSGLLAAIAGLLSLILRRRNVFDQPHDRWVLGFFAAALLSNPAWGWFGGALAALSELLPSILCYFLLRVVVRKPSHLAWVGRVLVAAALFHALNGISQFRTGVGLGGVAPLETRIDFDTDADGDNDPVRRIRGTGIFNDPNDLGMLFVATLPFLVGPLLRRRTAFLTRVGATGVMAPILTALYYTNSRGAVLGLGAALAPYGFRAGRAVGVLAGGLGLVALVALGPSRLGNMDTDESSAQGRVHSWSEGLQMFKSRPIFGVGFGRYTEFNELVAHNSFVHAIAELGAIGGLAFTGMMYWLFRGNRRPRTRGPDTDVERLGSWGDDLRTGSIGLCVCALFLSRQYSPMTFTWLAMSACYRSQLQERDPSVGDEGTFDYLAIGALLPIGIVVVYVAVRLLALWG